MPVSRISPIDHHCMFLNYVAVNTVITVRLEEPSNLTVARGTCALLRDQYLGGVLMTQSCVGRWTFTMCADEHQICQF